MAKKKLTLNLPNITTYLMIGLLVILLFSVYSIVQVQKQLREVKSSQQPALAKLTVTIIAAPQCDDCFDAQLFSTAVRQTPLTNITENTVAFDSIEGQKLITEYGITRLPAAVVTGETENITITGFTKTADAYVFTETPPPYYDLKLGGIIGRVSVTLITDASCRDCFDIAQFGDQLKQVGVSVTSTENLDFKDKEAQDLIKQYGITKIPTMLLSHDALAYDPVKQAWPQVGTEESDGMLVMRNPTPPYRDLASRQVRGMVTLTYLVDNTCTACYNVSLHKQVLEQSFGMKFKQEKTVDISGPLGKQLIEKYAVTAIPTFLLDSEAAAYPLMAQAWSQVGTQHADGTFIFQKVDLLQGVAYKDLATNTIKNSTSTG